jgi:hypothetical protein
MSVASGAVMDALDNAVGSTQVTLFCLLLLIVDCGLVNTIVLEYIA